VHLAFHQTGEPIPGEWGGGTNRWPWAIPRLAGNVATKPELVGHFAAESPDFNLRVPDQLRVNVFLRHFEQWQRDRAAATTPCPITFNCDCRTITRPAPRPAARHQKSSVADNDLAVGRAVEAVSHSAFWDDTAIFILEDDAQGGADHVDAHRSLGIIVSKYAPHPPSGSPAAVDSRFYSTVSMLRTMETLLDVPPMNNNDAFASLISSVFAGPGDQPPFDADRSNQDNGLIYAANSADAPAPCNRSGWTSAMRTRPTPRHSISSCGGTPMGDQPPPAMLSLRRAKTRDDDD